MDRYDVVIIGGGLGGLECGVTLSKEGYRVCVLEKNARTGGCFQSFRHDGHILDTGIHYIGSMDEGQVLNQYFKYFGILDGLKMQRLDEEAFDVVCYQGNEYAYGMGHERFVEGLAACFPAERENLRRYALRLKEVGDLIHVDNLQHGLLSAGGLEYFSQSAWQEIKKSISDKTLQQVLAGTNLLYGGIRDKSTFYHHAMINNSNLEGAYRFIGGSMQVTDRLVQVIRQNGGMVLCNRQVTRLVMEEGRVTEIETENGERIGARYVISALHPQRTMELLDKTSRIKKAYISRINSLENSYGVFTAYLLLKKDAFPYINRNYYLHENTDVWYDRTRAGKSDCCLLSMAPVSDAERYTRVVSLMAPMYMEELRQWENTIIENRGTGYEEFKIKKAEQLIDMAVRHFPGLRGNIESVYSTTPLSFRDYTGTADGSAYGVVKNYLSPVTTLISPKTKIDNLYLTGQNLNVHGALGVTLTAMLTCAELLGAEYLAKKIGNI